MMAWKTADPPVPWSITGCAMLRERLPIVNGLRPYGLKVVRPKSLSANRFRLARGEPVVVAL